MEKAEYISSLISTLLQKTREGKISWIREEDRGIETVHSFPVPGLGIYFRLEEADPFYPDWRRFTISQEEDQLVSIGNPDILPNIAKGGLDQTLLPEVQELFNLAVLGPRRRTLSDTLRTLTDL